MTVERWMRRFVVFTFLAACGGAPAATPRATPVATASATATATVVAPQASATASVATVAPPAPLPANVKATCPLLATPYPYRVPFASAQELAQKTDAFRAKSGIAWDNLVLGDGGGIHVASTRDAKLFDEDAGTTVTPREHAAWLALVNDNPDVFATAGCQIGLTCERTGCSVTPGDGNARGFVSFYKSIGGDGKVRVSVYGALRRLPAIPPRKIDDATARRPHIGRKFSVVTPGARQPMSDPPNLRGPDRCAAVPPPLDCPQMREVIGDASNLRVTEAIMCVVTKTDESVRRVLGVTFTADGTAPMLRGAAWIDALTGESLQRVYECP
jgi:hypothetical protein